MGLFSVMGPFSLRHGIGPAVPNNFLGAFHPLNSRGECTVPMLMGEDTFNPLIVQEPLTAANASRFVESSQSALSDFPYPLFDDDYVIPLAATHNQWEIVEYDPSAIGQATCGAVMVRQRATGAVVSFGTMEDDGWRITTGIEWESPDGQKNPAIISLLRTVCVLPDAVATTGFTIMVSANHIPQLFGTSDRCTPFEAGQAICRQYLESRGGRGRIAKNRIESGSGGVLDLVFDKPRRERCHVVVQGAPGTERLTLVLSIPEGLSDQDLADGVVARWWQSGARLVRHCACYD